MTLTLEVAPKGLSALRLRIPGWATDEVLVSLNGSQAARGRPGSYSVLEREWQAGDKIRLRLPLGLRASRYRGFDTVSGCERYAFEWGPLLLGAVGRLDSPGAVIFSSNRTLRNLDCAH